MDDGSERMSLSDCILDICALLSAAYILVGLAIAHRRVRQHPVITLKGQNVGRNFA
jgi:hypothetical protein